MIRALPLLILCVSCETTGSTLSAHRDARPIALEIEGGPVWQRRNDVRIPGDTGTRFSLRDLIGNGPFAVGRVTLDWDIDPHHALRGVIAPLQFSDTGTLAKTTSFDGQTFAGGVATKGTYKFNNYRLGYRYTFLHNEYWRLRVGGTLFVRDAKVELEQGGLSASDSDIGLVPLLNFGADYFPSNRWRIGGEFNGLASSQGRAFDIALKAHYDVTDRCSLGLGYRMIEGGADNDSVYTFAFLQSVIASVTLRF